MGGLTNKVCGFAKGAQVNCVTFLILILEIFGLSSWLSKKSKQTVKRRAKLGLYPVGVTALFVIILMLAFLFVSAGK